MVFILFEDKSLKENIMLITPDQIRAARALKNWSQTDLAERTGLAVPTIANIEAGKQAPGGKTLEKISTAFDKHGIEFIGDRGVQKKQSQIQIYSGIADFEKFYDDIYNSLQKQPGEVVVANVDEREFLYFLSDEKLLKHRENMLKLGDKVHYKILIKEDDTFFAATSYAEYRWTPADDFQSIPFYVFANKLAIILWLDEPLVFLIENNEASSIYREKFSVLWDNAKIPNVKPEIYREFVMNDLPSISAFKKKMGVRKAGK
jgi:transcriptional regulator with XRE-family HTH domain